MVFLGRIIDGITAGNLSLAQAYISRMSLKPEERAKSFGIIGIAFGLGFLIGPGNFQNPLPKWDYRYPIYAAALMSFTSIMATTFLLPMVTPKQAPAGAAAGSHRGKRLSLVQWGEYGRYFKQPGPEQAAVAVLDVHVVVCHVRHRAASISRKAAQLAWAPFPGPEQTGYAWAYVRIPGNFFAVGPGMERGR